MKLKEILLELETANHPVVKALHKGEQFKTIAIGFKKGMILKEHKTNLPAKLFVIQGKVIYKQGEVFTLLNAYDEIEIPTNILHSVEATEDSLCLLTQG